MITILDYGVGNLGSVQNMLKKIGCSPRLSAKAEEIESAEKLILPGVGSFAACVGSLKASGLLPALERRVLDRKVPVLGICVGMQMMTRHSAEGSASGLGWLPANTVRFELERSHPDLRVPHMGWNFLRTKPDPLFRDFNGDERFYFVHSYYVKCDDPAHEIAQTDFGETYVSAFRKENIWGVQFHPEKSHRFGMALLKNFVEVCR